MIYVTGNREPLTASRTPQTLGVLLHSLNVCALGCTSTTTQFLPVTCYHYRTLCHIVLGVEFVLMSLWCGAPNCGVVDTSSLEGVPIVLVGRTTYLITE